MALRVHAVMSHDTKEKKTTTTTVEASLYANMYANTRGKHDHYLVCMQL